MKKGLRLYESVDRHLYHNRRAPVAEALCGSRRAHFPASANRSFQAYITAKSCADIYYITHRATHSDEKTRQILAKVLYLFTPLDTTGSDCRQALISNMSDYEDAIMAETARRSHMDCIVTRNIKDYTASSVPVLSPEDFIATLDRP